MVSLTSGGLEKQSVSLTSAQWAWLEEIAAAHQTFSKSAELRRLVEQERSKEARESEAVAA